MVVKNLDDNPTPGNITVGYILNGGTPVTETIIAPALAAGDTIWHTFGTSIDLSAVGSYELVTFVSQIADPVLHNDTLIKTFRQLDNPLISSIAYPATFTDNFDAAPVQSYTTRQFGLTGLDRYDFVTSTDLGRIRTFVNTGIAYSGNRALTLDATVYNGGTVDSLTGTYNLSSFNAATDDIRLDFRYKNHDEINNAANKVWIRGSDLNATWINAYDLFANQLPAKGSYKKTKGIELSTPAYSE